MALLSAMRCLACVRATSGICGKFFLGLDINKSWCEPLKRTLPAQASMAPRTWPSELICIFGRLQRTLPAQASMARCTKTPEVDAYLAGSKRQSLPRRPRAPGLQNRCTLDWLQRHSLPRRAWPRAPGRAGGRVPGRLRGGAGRAGAGGAGAAPRGGHRGQAAEGPRPGRRGVAALGADRHAPVCLACKLRVAPLTSFPLPECSVLAVLAALCLCIYGTVIVPYHSPV